MNKTGRYAVITPYYKEAKPILERCMGSVRHQTIPADHFMVADGYPQAWIDGERVRHLKLDRAHDDGGNTPRGLGALLAVAESYDGICFLDADNWFDRDHIEVVLDAASSKADCDFAVAKCRYVRPDESVIDVEPEPDHVDTSCFFFLQGSFHTIHHWLMPNELAPICDRVFYAAIRSYGLRAVLATKATVNYLYTWAPMYRWLGEVPPVPDKPNPDHAAIRRWVQSLNQRELEILQRRTGAKFKNGELLTDMERMSTVQGKVPRNALCPCGSGLKFKHCHGRLP